MIYSIISIDWSRRSRDGMVVGFITTYAIQCLSPLTLWVRIPLRGGVLDIALCDKVYHYFTTDRWFSSCTAVSPIHIPDRHDIAEILLKAIANKYNYA